MLTLSPPFFLRCHTMPLSEAIGFCCARALRVAAAARAVCALSPLLIACLSYQHYHDTPRYASRAAYAMPRHATLISLAAVMIDAAAASAMFYYCRCFADIPRLPRATLFDAAMLSRYVAFTPCRYAAAICFRLRVTFTPRFYLLRRVVDYARHAFCRASVAASPRRCFLSRRHDDGVAATRVIVERPLDAPYKRLQFDIAMLMPPLLLLRV